MADTKISALSAGAPAQSTDELPAARAGTNVKLTVADLQTFAQLLLPGSVDPNDVLTVSAGDHTADRSIAVTASASGVNVNLDSGRLVVADPIQATRVHLSNGTTHGTSVYDSGSGDMVFYLDDAISNAGAVAQLAQVANVGRFKMGSNGLIGWSSAGAIAADADTALVRDAAAGIKATNGSTGAAYIKSLKPVVANTGTASPGIPDSGTIYTNSGDADGSIVNLPDNPTIGTTFEFAVLEAQTLTVNAASGETIRDAATTGTSIVADAAGEYLKLVAVTGGSGAVWMVMGKQGTWTLS